MELFKLFNVTITEHVSSRTNKNPPVSEKSYIIFLFRQKPAYKLTDGGINVSNGQLPFVLEL